MLSPSSSDALVVTAGPLAGQTLPLERRELVVGRDPGCDLALTTYTQLSRRHARLVPTPTGWGIEDLGSTNGTLLDGARVERAALRHGARLKLGDFEALVRVYEAAPQHTVVTPVPQAPLHPQVPLQPPHIPGVSPVVAPRKNPKWLWPALGVGAFFVVAALALGGGSSSSPKPVDAATDAKAKRAIDTGDASDPQNGDSTSPRGNDSQSPQPQAQLAPPVNGRIAPETIALAKSATVLIVRPEGQAYSFGSGFVSGNGHQVITNRHVVADQGGSVGDCLLVFDAGTSREHKVKVAASDIEVAQGNEKFSDDLAVLNLPADADLPAALPLGRSEDLSETDTTWVFGFPLGVGTLTLDRELPSVSVKAASIERIQRGQVDGSDAAKVLQLGSTVTHGNSGGPILNAKGEVVGVISSGDEGTGMSYAIPTVWVKRLVK